MNSKVKGLAAKKELPGFSTLDRGLTVLEAVLESAFPLSIQEIARNTGIQRLAVYRLLCTLEQRGYVLRDDAKLYRSASQRNVQGRQVTIGFLAPLEGNAFRADLVSSLTAAARKAGANLLLFDNREDDVATALENTSKLLNSRVDAAIFFQPVEAIGHMVADSLFRSQVPFVTVERPIQGGVYYGANNFQAGKMAGIVLAQFARNNWKSRFDRVVLLETMQHNPNVQARVTGVLVGLREVLGEIEESHVIHLDGKAHVESSQAAVNALLKKMRPGTRLLISGFNDLSAVGASRAVREAKRESDVAIVGQNAAREGQMEIRRRGSRMIASIAYFPEKYGANLIRLAMDLAAGRKTPPTVYTNHVALDRHNLDRFYPVLNPVE